MLRGVRDLLRGVVRAVGVFPLETRQEAFIAGERLGSALHVTTPLLRAIASARIAGAAAGTEEGRARAQTARRARSYLEIAEYESACAGCPDGAAAPDNPSVALAKALGAIAAAAALLDSAPGV